MIFLECNADEFLIKTLGFSKKLISHERCKGEVVKKVGKNQKAIGMIDEDPGSPPPRDLDKYSKTTQKGTLTLFTQPKNKNKRLIQISPYLEHWLLNRAKSNKIKPGDFNLPEEPKKLHKIPHIERNKNFKEFLHKIIETDAEMQTLKTWLDESLDSK